MEMMFSMHATTVVVATCGGVLNALPRAQSVHSPRYDPWDNNKAYDNNQECSWLIRVSEFSNLRSPSLSFIKE